MSLDKDELYRETIRLDIVIRSLAHILGFKDHYQSLGAVLSVCIIGRRGSVDEPKTEGDHHVDPIVQPIESWAFCPLPTPPTNL